MPKDEIKEPRYCIWCGEVQMEVVDESKDGDVLYECPNCGDKLWKSEF